MATLFTMVGAGFVLTMMLMGLLWLYYLVKKNAAVVDLGWTASFILIVWAYLIFGDGYAPRRWAIALMVTIWSGRLLWHLIRRFKPEEEDPRYTEMLKGWGKESLNLKVLLMFVFQGLIALLLSIPFLIVCLNTRESWSFWEGWGVLIWIIGVAGESLADWQMDQFKRNPETKGQVCDRGLWSISRHPNYFFEWVVWIGFFIFALSSPFGWIAIFAPALMLYLLLHVTGIPPSEARALKSKGEAYREYQLRTSIFVPWLRH